MSSGCPIPTATPQTGLRLLRAMVRERSLLKVLEMMFNEIGPAFRITLPGFEPVVLVGPGSNRQIMVSQREQFRWRNPSDPVTRLLRHGLLVEDGEKHACLRAQMEPVLQKSKVVEHIPQMQAYTDFILSDWADGSVRDMLVEMRRIALLIFMGALLDVPFDRDMDRLWQPILRTIKYISPGLWIVWPEIPRPGYGPALAQLDDYLYAIIRARRVRLQHEDHVSASFNRPAAAATDLLTHLVANGMADDLIRDQILTMLIAGHDTSTALLAWTLHLLGHYPAVMAQAQAEVDTVLDAAAPTAGKLNQLVYLEMVLKETLRLYPPIHVANRIAAEDTAVAGYEVKAGTRVMASIYLSHRDGRYWDTPQQFRPERFARGTPQPPPLTYVPFGAGPRHCPGASFAQVEAKVVLARILQQFELDSSGGRVRPSMGATLEPHPGVFLRVRRRRR
jgi:cytochrome P450